MWWNDGPAAKDPELGKAVKLEVPTYHMRAITALPSLPIGDRDFTAALKRSQNYRRIAQEEATGQ